MIAPTRKWAVTQITALAALATMWATTGSWDTEETVAAIGLFAQAAIGYLTPNVGTTDLRDERGQYEPLHLLVYVLVFVVLVVILLKVVDRV